MELNRIPKPILVSFVVIIALVALWHFGSKWYFSQRDVEFYINQAEEFRQLISALLIENLDDSLEAESRSPELAEKVQDFNDFLTNHPFLQYEDDAVSKLILQYGRPVFLANKPQVGKQLSKYYLDFHGFHIELMRFYVQGKLPYEPHSDELKIVRAFIHGYSQVLKEMDDPFLLKAFQEKELEEALRYLRGAWAYKEYRAWQEDPRRQQKEEYYDSLRKSRDERTNKGSQ